MEKIAAKLKAFLSKGGRAEFFRMLCFRLTGAANIRKDAGLSINAFAAAAARCFYN